MVMPECPVERGGQCTATVTRVAQRHDITRQQLYAWRHALKRKGPSLSDSTDDGARWKYECVYLNAFEIGSGVRKAIDTRLSYYNDERPHSSHGLLTPCDACDTTSRNLKAAA